MRRLLALLGVAMCGCAGRTVHDRAVHELHCTNVEVESISDGTFVATGCGKSATYTCISSTVGQTMFTRSACVRDDPPSDGPVVVVAPSAPAQPSGPSQFPPPTGAGGFDFGIGDDATRTACEGAGHVYTSKKYGAICDGLVKDIEQPAVARLRFCDNLVCEVALVVERSETLEQSVLKWKASLIKKYGQPTSTDSHVDSECNDLAQCVIDKRASVKVDWLFPQRQSIELTTMQTGDDAASVRVKIVYASGQRTGDGL